MENMDVNIIELLEYLKSFIAPLPLIVSVPLDKFQLKLAPTEMTVWEYRVPTPTEKVNKRAKIFVFIIIICYYS